MKQVRMPSYPCPACGAPLSAAADPLGEAVPRPGDLSICKECRALLQFREDFSLRFAEEAIVEAYRKEIDEVLKTIERKN